MGAGYVPDELPCLSALFVRLLSLSVCLLWLRGKDLNQRPSGYEPDELPTALPRDD